MRRGNWSRGLGKEAKRERKALRPGAKSCNLCNAQSEVSAGKQRLSPQLSVQCTKGARNAATVRTAAMASATRVIVAGSSGVSVARPMGMRTKASVDPRHDVPV